MKRLNPYLCIVFSLAGIYIIFGILKVAGKSPIFDLVAATFPFMNNMLLFALFGVFEVVLGIGLLFKSVRKYAAIGIMLHLMSTFLTLVFASSRIFSPTTIVTLEGEFVIKNILLIAVAYYIFSEERKK